MIKIKEFDDEKEKCCFCRKDTSCWTDLQDRSPVEQVACCHIYCRHANIEDVPSRKLWTRRERIAMSEF